MEIFSHKLKAQDMYMIWQTVANVSGVLAAWGKAMNIMKQTEAGNQALYDAQDAYLAYKAAYPPVRWTEEEAHDAWAYDINTADDDSDTEDEL